MAAMERASPDVFATIRYSDMVKKKARTAPVKMVSNDTTAT